MHRPAGRVVCPPSRKRAAHDDGTCGAPHAGVHVIDRVTTVNTDAGTGAVPGLETKRGGLGSRAQSVALATLCTVLFLTFLDNTVVSVGLADVQSNLHAGVSSLQWVVNGYALTFAAFMLAGGSLGDLLGRKKIMLAGVVIFCAGSVVSALAPNVDWLIAGRVVMGLGAAASEPGTLSIIRHVYPRQGDQGRRPRSVGRRVGPGARPRPRHRRNPGRHR
jgi:hypothetical protein